MIIFKQCPLNGLNTFEDEILFLLAGTIKLIAGIGPHSIINKERLLYVYFIGCDSPVDNVSQSTICNLCKKYNKSFQGKFEFRLTKVGSKWKLNIKENMDKVSEEIAPYV